MSNPIQEHLQILTRRHFFGRSALGLGTAALTALLPPRSGAAEAATDGLPGYCPADYRYVAMPGQARGELDAMVGKLSAAYDANSFVKSLRRSRQAAAALLPPAWWLRRRGR